MTTDGKGFFRRRRLAVGFLAVLLPLAVLLAIQFRSLARLESTSHRVQRAELREALERSAAEIEAFYRSAGSAACAIVPEVFLENRLDDAASAFSAARVRGARRLFVLSFVGTDAGKLLVYDPTVPSMELPDDASEARAVYVAAEPWRRRAWRPEELRPGMIATDEHDPEHRVILCPVVHPERGLVGVAGMIADPDYMKETLVPEAAARALEGTAPTGLDGAALVAIRRSGEDPSRSESPDEVAVRLPFLFTDTQLVVRGASPVPSPWATARSRWSMALSALTALVLVGGTVLALRTAAKEMRLSQMKSDFVSNVSHELRTPLSSIRVFAELLRLGRAPGEDKVREYGRYIEAESTRLTQLINNLLDFSRIESGRKQYRFETADLREVVEGVVQTFRVALRGTEGKVDLAGDPPPPSVVMDSDAIAQAVHNLLDNAVKYSPAAPVVTVRVFVRDGAACVSVRDAGVGIPRSEHAKIFDRFHRGGVGPRHDVKGSGLGLSIVKHIVDAHGGSIEVESEPGRGSAFTIRLPLDGAPAREAARA